MISSGSDEAARSASANHGLKYTSFVLLLAACFIDGADLQLLPSSFKALETDLGLSPIHLGQLAMIQALFMASLAPFWGSLADMGVYPKKTLLTVAVASWGIFTIMMSMVSNFYAMMILRALIGSCLACILPLSQTCIAAESEPHERGRIFGWVQFFQYMGQVSSALFATSISNKIFTVSGTSFLGWRLGFFTVGFLSLGVAALLALLLEELPQRHGLETPQSASVSGVFSDVFMRARSYSKIASFRIVVLQGLFGSIPFQAMGFLPMFFMYIGFQDQVAALLVTSFLFTQAVGSLLGGHIGDFAAHISRHHGRIFVAQIAVAAQIPCVALLFKFVPQVPASLMLYVSALWCLGLFTWVMTGVKRPILSEIVRSEDWASLLALDTGLEGSSAAIFGAPLVGILSQSVFGYKPVDRPVSQIPVELRAANTHALAQGMFWMTVVPWGICLVIWGVLHSTYPRDIDTIQGGQVTEDDFEGIEEPLLKLDMDDGCTSYAY